MKKILVISNRLTRFVKDDIEILSRSFDVKYFNNVVFSHGLLRSVKKSEVIIVWFNSKHTIWPFLLAKLFKKKIILITGGYDTANIPEINYGLRQNYFISSLLNLVVNYANWVIVNSRFAFNELNSYGVRTDHVTTLFHALVEPHANVNTKRVKQILYVGDVTKSNLKRKGLEYFLEYSNMNLDYRFVCIGKISDKMMRELSGRYERVQFAGFIEESELISYFKKSSIIFQLSRHEAFGLSVVQAMNYGCVPIVLRDSGALPEVISPFGFVLGYYNDIMISTLINDVEELSSEYRFEMSNYVMNKYSITNREKGFRSIINSLTINSLN
jgi:glycosyltransferase involved in cell wall biosynthesis